MDRLSVDQARFTPDQIPRLERTRQMYCREKSPNHGSPSLNQSYNRNYGYKAENNLSCEEDSLFYNLDPKYDDVFYVDEGPTLAGEGSWRYQGEVTRTTVFSPNQSAATAMLKSRRALQANASPRREKSTPASTCSSSSSALVQFPRSFSCNGSVKFLQASLFPNVAPTVFFGTADEKISDLPKELRHCLKWKLSSITPQLIKDTVSRSGFRLIRERQKSRRWLGTWCKHIKSGDFGPFADYQKLNHFPGSFHIGRKDKLWFNLSAKAAKFGENFQNFHPRTYVLPQDLRELRKSYISSETSDGWKMILKPPASARGNGITVISKWSQIPKFAKITRKYNKPALIVQEYISRPCLLFNGAKFDLRIYVLVTSFDPLRVYIFDDGLVRFASVKYDPNADTLDEPYMHLTNYSINKNNEGYRSNDDEEALAGHKWTLKTLWKHLEGTGLVDVSALKRKIADMVVKSLIACEQPITKLFKKHSKSRYTCFELLGFDVMLDENFKPWLLEVNISPSLRSESSLDSAVKGALIKDMLNIVGYQLPAFAADELSVTVPPEHCQDEQLHLTKLGLREKEKRRRAIIDPNLNLLEDLSPDDIRILIETEDEASRAGRFNRVFPTADTRTYLKYITPTSLYYNRLLADWTESYMFKKDEGIRLLQSLCEAKYHMRRDENLIDRLLLKWKAVLKKATRRTRRRPALSIDGPDDGNSDSSATEIDLDGVSGGRSSEASGGEQVVSR